MGRVVRDTKNDTKEQKISKDKCLSDNSSIIIPGTIIGTGNNNGNGGDRSLGDTILTVYHSPHYYSIAHFQSLRNQSVRYIAWQKRNKKY